MIQAAADAVSHVYGKVHTDKSDQYQAPFLGVSIFVYCKEIGCLIKKAANSTMSTNVHKQLAIHENLVQKCEQVTTLRYSVRVLHVTKTSAKMDIYNIILTGFIYRCLI